MLHIEIREVVEGEEGTEELAFAPTRAATIPDARRYAQAEAEARNGRVRLFIVGNDDEFHEPIEDGDYWDTKALAKRAIAELPEKLELIFVDYRDQLSDEQVTWILEGDIDKAIEDMWEWESDNQHYSIRELLKECLPDHDDREALLDSNDYESFEQECYDRDQSTPLDDLMRNTPGVMIRYYLNHSVAPNSWAMTVEEQEDEADAIIKAAGLELTEANRRAARTLVIEASYGGELCVLHQTDIKDAFELITHGGSVTFTNPYLLVYDGFNGSGMDAEVEATITWKLSDDHPMRHDAGSYSWSDDIAGVVHSAYDTPAEFHISKKEQAA